MELPTYWDVLFYCRPQRSWGKVIVSEACVKNSVHGGGGGRAWQGACVAGVCVAGGHAWERKAYMVWGCTWGGMHA